MSDVAHPGLVSRPGFDEVRTLRAGILRGSVGPSVVALYALATLGAPRRPEMLLTVVAMAVPLSSVWLLARHILRSRWRFAWQIAAILTQIVGMAGLLYLDGGVRGPLGALAVFAMLLFAATLPRRVFLIVCGATGVAYWTVAQVGPPPPPGYAETMIMGTGGVAYLCHRYAAALRTLRRRLADISRTDPLTGCLNRRGFDERLQAEMDRSRRKGTELSLVVADLDRFKEVNDTYGHLVGDDLLAWTGRTLRERLRAHDVVGRLGGDEFAVILPDTGAEGAVAAVRRFRDALGDIAPGSFGIATRPGDAGTVDDLKAAADRRLYEDKRGRERPGPRADVRAAIHRAADDGEARRVSRFERRRRTIQDFGTLAAACHAIGLVYALLYSGSPHRPAIVALLCLGALCGLATAAGARRLSRVRGAGTWMSLISLPEFAAAAAAVVLDGGVMSPLALGLLAPLPLVAFGTPPRQAAPIVGGVVATYLGIGVVVGGAGAWYPAMYTGGATGLALACGFMGRAAARQRQLLTRLSRVDALTECLNRRGFEERTDAELSRIRRAGGTALLLVLDLDGFKQLNDTQGHAAGDELLQWIGETLRAETAAGDAVGRLGGDEFVVLATGAGEPATVVAQRFEAALAPRTAVSVGTATLGADGADFATLYGHADAELYRRKAARRRDAAAGVPTYAS